MNPKIVTLKENRDFKRLYAKGKSCPHPLLVTYARKNRLNISRIGITTSKKIGNAVSRNRGTQGHTGGVPLHGAGTSRRMGFCFLWHGIKPL